MPALGVVGFGDTGREARLLAGLELDICSKWERREDTGFYIRSVNKNSKHLAPRPEWSISTYYGRAVKALLPRFLHSQHLQSERSNRDRFGAHLKLSRKVIEMLLCPDRNWNRSTSDSLVMWGHEGAQAEPRDRPWTLGGVNQGILGWGEEYA